MNVIEWMLNFAETIKTTFGGFSSFLVQSITVGTYTFEMYELLFGGALFTVIVWGIVSFIIDILP